MPWRVSIRWKLHSICKMFISFFCKLRRQTRITKTKTHSKVSKTKWIFSAWRSNRKEILCNFTYVISNNFWRFSIFLAKWYTLSLYSQVCDKFYFCVDGVANPITCPESLIFNPASVRILITINYVIWNNR